MNTLSVFVRVFEWYGAVAKWLGSGLQIRRQRFESARRLQLYKAERSLFLKKSAVISAATW